jgi:(2R)-3-sulfolactate dehydrogenase (NADP+)
VDSEGQATQDPSAVLNGGSLVSSGGYKGYGFGLMAEILAAAFTGGSTSTQLDPLKASEGKPHDLGQCYIIIDPTNVAGDLFWEKLSTISEAVTSQPGARIPGANKVLPEAVELDVDVWESVKQLAGV